MKRYLVFCILLGVLIFGLTTGYFWGFGVERKVLMASLEVIHPIRNYTSSYKFISPLLAYVIPSADQQAYFPSTKKKIVDFIDKEKASKNISDASVFFYDLNRGRWLGINETQEYNPASMLKVVIMVSYFKEAETMPSILQKKLIYTGEMNDYLKNNSFNSTSTLAINHSYSIEELIEKMIIDSDNGAEVVLFNSINKENLDAIYNALNIPNPEHITNNFVISPRTYSLFFRIIYSATYINENLSEKALDILSRATFNDGIVAGLPKDTIVAHKFGQYVTGKNYQVENLELHDCGIVYYPANPYFLCIMTRGKNESALKGVIKNISSMVYQAYGSYK